MNVQKRNNVHVFGDGPVTLVFAHGFGFDQTIWRYLTDAFASRYQIILLDLVGSGQSDLSAYDRVRHGTLEGHADDLLEILAEFATRPVVFIGHSVSSTIGMLAAIKEPERFSALVMLGPTPSLINDNYKDKDNDYVGGFERADIDELLRSLESNYLGWSRMVAPTVLGVKTPSDPGGEFIDDFCRNDAEIAKHFAGVAFLSDHRADLARVTTPTLIVQSSNDPFVPLSVGSYMHRIIPGSVLTVTQTIGHCPHVSAPAACIEAIEAFLQTRLLVADGNTK
jgi:sigma-B regulation protein RsbQ